MWERSSTAAELAVAAAAALMLMIGGTQAADPKYPDWKGQWSRYLVPGVGGQGAFDQTKFWGRGQQAPLTPEYQKVLEDSMADQADGGWAIIRRPCARWHAANDATPEAQEYIITPETTYIMVGGAVFHVRPIFTMAASFPAKSSQPIRDSSAGGWMRMATADTACWRLRPAAISRARALTIIPACLRISITSRFSRRGSISTRRPGLLHDEVTAIDHALTRPWSVDRRYIHNPDPRAQWPEVFCIESNVNVVVGKENYTRSADGYLMPTRKDQAPPDLRYFKQPPK